MNDVSKLTVQLVEHGQELSEKGAENSKQQSQIVSTTLPPERNNYWQDMAKVMSEVIDLPASHQQTTNQESSTRVELRTISEQEYREIQSKNDATEIQHAKQLTAEAIKADRPQVRLEANREMIENNEIFGAQELLKRLSQLMVQSRQLISQDRESLQRQEITTQDSLTMQSRAYEKKRREFALFQAQIQQIQTLAKVLNSSLEELIKKNIDLPTNQQVSLQELQNNLRELHRILESTEGFEQLLSRNEISEIEQLSEQITTQVKNLIVVEDKPESQGVGSDIERIALQHPDATRNLLQVDILDLQNVLDDSAQLKDYLPKIIDKVERRIGVAESQSSTFSINAQIENDPSLGVLLSKPLFKNEAAAKLMGEGVTNDVQKESDLLQKLAPERFSTERKIDSSLQPFFVELANKAEQDGNRSIALYATLKALELTPITSQDQLLNKAQELVTSICEQPFASDTNLFFEHDAERVALQQKQLIDLGVLGFDEKTQQSVFYLGSLHSLPPTILNPNNKALLQLLEQVDCAALLDPSRREPFELVDEEGTGHVFLPLAPHPAGGSFFPVISTAERAEIVEKMNVMKSRLADDGITLAFIDDRVSLSNQKNQQIESLQIDKLSEKGLAALEELAPGVTDRQRTAAIIVGDKVFLPPAGDDGNCYVDIMPLENWEKGVQLDLDWISKAVNDYNQVIASNSGMVNLRGFNRAIESAYWNGVGDKRTIDIELEGHSEVVRLAVSRLRNKGVSQDLVQQLMRTQTSMAVQGQEFYKGQQTTLVAVPAVTTTACVTAAIALPAGASAVVLKGAAWGTGFGVVRYGAQRIDGVHDVSLTESMLEGCVVGTILGPLSRVPKVNTVMALSAAPMIVKEALGGHKATALVDGLAAGWSPAKRLLGGRNLLGGKIPGTATSKPIKISPPSAASAPKQVGMAKPAIQPAATTSSRISAKVGGAVSAKVNTYGSVQPAKPTVGPTAPKTGAASAVKTSTATKITPQPASDGAALESGLPFKPRLGQLRFNGDVRPTTPKTTPPSAAKPSTSIKTSLRNGDGAMAESGLSFKPKLSQLGFSGDARPTIPKTAASSPAKPSIPAKSKQPLSRAELERRVDILEKRLVKYDAQKSSLLEKNNFSGSAKVQGKIVSSERQLQAYKSRLSKMPKQVEGIKPKTSEGQGGSDAGGSGSNTQKSGDATKPKYHGSVKKTPSGPKPELQTSGKKDSGTALMDPPKTGQGQGVKNRIGNFYNKPKGPAPQKQPSKQGTSDVKKDNNLAKTAPAQPKKATVPASPQRSNTKPQRATTTPAKANPSATPKPANPTSPKPAIRPSPSPTINPEPTKTTPQRSAPVAPRPKVPAPQPSKPAIEPARPQRKPATRPHEQVSPQIRHELKRAPLLGPQTLLAQKFNLELSPYLAPQPYPQPFPQPQQVKTQVQQQKRVKDDGGNSSEEEKKRYKEILLKKEEEATEKKHEEDRISGRLIGKNEMIKIKGIMDTDDDPLLSTKGYYMGKQIGTPG